MTEEQYLSLCEKYFKGICTPEEIALIKNYQHEFGIDDPLWDTNMMGDKARIKGLLQARLQNSLSEQKPKIITFKPWRIAAIAASLLLFTCTGLYLVLKRNTLQISYTAKHNNIPSAEIQPGSNKAVLTLSTGQSIVLDNAKNGLLSKQGDVAISKSGDGLVVKNSGANQLAAQAALNTITIPRGGKYDIVLPDGTRVWLNSSSSLTFPTAFIGSERKVTLTGEAYFEVAKNKAMPFRVNVNNKQVVEVLGTHFNISAYTDEQEITTTLLEGSVKVNYKNTTSLLKPGQMAVNNPAGGITVQDANIDEVMAWKNGLFQFNNENITTVMKKVSRWYDVDVDFKGDMTSVNFDGNYSRSKTLTNLLKNIELMDKVHFVVEGRRVIVIGK
ncbi:FecR domain-containing protein [Mucilaginibacter sp.]|uniref:FecR family protein n=1 Tax=Mucilaginibacter sp. TaxID=1882438 RepID=UPI0032635D69